MPPYMMYHTHSFIGPILMIAIWIVQVLIAYLIWKDAKEQKMLAPVWAILAILPMFGYLVDVLYLVIRELRPSRKTEIPPASL
jgi:hypothetical protein